MDKLYTPKEVADIARVQKHTVWKWLREGSLRGAQLTPRIWRISETDLEEFLKGLNSGIDNG